jgi:uncharacterized damage-inducible protein DinB
MNLKVVKAIFLKDKNTGMNLKAILFSFGLLSSLYGRCQTSMTAGADRLLNYIEQHITEVAEAMPENRFDFTPDSLNIPGSQFKDVRSFAGQVKHLATDNFFIWSAITGDPIPAGIDDVNGPASLKTKAAILAYLKQSFAVGHKAIATLTTNNAMDMIDFRGRKLPRVDLAFYALTHANEHYGQLVIYLRMCGIIPPASRPDRPQ